MAQLPKDFIWGTACASFQCEGAWQSDGKGESIWDEFCHNGGNVKNDDNGDVACDSFHRVEEDVALMRRLGTKVHRFSLSWPRIFPDGKGAINPKGFDYYDRLTDALLEAGIEPWITLYHWDLPVALQREGGWLNRATVDAFARYAEAVGRHFDGRVKCYMPINEPQCISVLGYGNGEHAPGWRLGNEYVLQVIHNLRLAHAYGEQALRGASASPLTIGTVTTGRLCYPSVSGTEAEEAAYRASFDLSRPTLHDWAFTHNIYLDSLCLGGCDDSAPDFVKRFEDAVPAAERALFRKPDFIGLNVYNGTRVDANGLPEKLPTGFSRTAIGWPVTPEVMYYGPRHLHRRYGLPIIVTEDGVACNDRVYRDGRVHDADRIDFLARYLTELARAKESGADVRGYLHWSILDNFEWAEGYDQRFGLIYMDYAECKRIPKDSFDWYAAVCKSGTVE